MLLDETFTEVTEKTKELLNQTAPVCCEWEECQIGSDLPTNPDCGFDCLFNDAYKKTVVDTLTDEKKQTRFLTGCFLQEDLNFYCPYYPDLKSGWLNFVCAMGQGFVHQRIYKETAVRSTVRENPGKAVSLIDQTAGRALDILIKSPLQSGNKWATDSWSASSQALMELVSNSADMALVASQIGETLPRQLRNDSDYSGLFDEIVIPGDIVGRYNEEGVICPDATIIGFGCLVLRAFIAEKVETEFPGDFEKFMRERKKVAKQIHERQREE